ncbi:VOC family protein [Marinomonas posidonica]|uniref:Glyoxalase/bleomycin resistance protein/dioxygenase n=1 Tax=Marinomonas posidonica (strain CECT 7376 / NCIMB 14433 / IVIA-Po-181) TaxID=491952 RepID=F6CX44_MARPP|nr:VOC family protein [Marinomonas posidonica]AEF53298.1 glyoxalase/bleomycin resistance protein/dioxygenase [Marinomonas posidonica IVIA-Po-181]
MELSNFPIFYVDDVQASVDFYRPLLERDPVEQQKDFALFVSESGNKFGLWAWHDVLPKTDKVVSASMEIALEVGNLITLQIHYRKWSELGVEMIQDIDVMDFGTSFTALDPDGHRLRVFCYEK